MSWWGLPIEDADLEGKRKFSHKVFLDQVIDILDACVPLYNWKTGREIEGLGPYVLNVTNAQAIWRSIQTRIEVLVGRDDVAPGPSGGGSGEPVPGIPVFYDYATLDNASWFAAGSPTDPRAQPDYMHYNVFKRFKELARAVPDIPLLHLMRQEDVEATSISTNVPPRNPADETVYNFAAGIVGFKWDSVSVDEFTQTYYENMGSYGPDDDYYAVVSTGSGSEDGGIYFSNGNYDDPITIRYNVDTTRFGWTKRVNGKWDQDGTLIDNISTESFNESTRELSVTLTASLEGAHELDLYSVVNIRFENSFNLDVAITTFISDTSFIVTLPTGIDPADHGGTSAVRDIFETGEGFWEDRARPGDVIHACLLNQIYACTVVLQDYAVLVDASNSNVAGATLADGYHSWGTEVGPLKASEYCATDDGNNEETWTDACNRAKLPSTTTGGYLADHGSESDTNTSCSASGGPTGTDACVGWTGSRTTYALRLTGVPIGHGGVMVKDFAHLPGPDYIASYETGVPDMVAPYISGGLYKKTAELTETNQESSEFTLATHGSGPNPLTVSPPISCTDGCDPVPEEAGATCRTGGDYSADGWACVQQISPDPESP